MSQQSTEQVYEAVLVGAGPVGIEIAVSLKKAGIHYVHFDAGQVGQTIYNFPYQTRFFSSNERIAIAGVPLQTTDQNKATREQYLAYLRTVVLLFDLAIETYERIVSIERDGEDFRVTTRGFEGQRTWRTRRIILSTGGTAHPRKLDIPGEDQPNVHHHFTEPHVYFRKKVLVVGGKNSAIEAALRCYHVGAQVSLSYRREKLDAAHIKYWLYPEITGLVHACKIIGHFNTIPTRFENGVATLVNPQTQEQAQVEADFLLPLIGYEADMSLAKMAGVELDGPTQSPKVNPHTMETNVPGVFIAGTAIGGTQDQFRIFIENCHHHCDRIVAAIQGRTLHEHKEVQYLRPES